MPAPDKDKYPEKYKEYCQKKREAISGKNNPWYGKKRTYTKEEREKNSKTTKEQWADPNSIYNTAEFRERRKQSIAGKKKSTEHCKKISELKKKQWANPDSKFNSKEYRKKQSKALSGVNNPMFGRQGIDNPNYGSERSEETKILMGLSSSVARLQDWQKPDYQNKQKKSRSLKPNAFEFEVGNIIPSGFIYVGDFSKFIGGKNPDFINEEKGLIIETYGDYYHQGGEKEAQDRINYFKQHGYDTLVIWESSFCKNPQKIKDLIIDFSNHKLKSAII